METQRVEFANTLRAYAAVSVLIQHYGFVFWESRAVVANLVAGPALPDSIQAPFYLKWLSTIQPFDLGQFGVGLFFLISGFVIPFTLDRASRSSFLIGRLTRIYPTYAAGLICTILGVWASAVYFGGGFPFEGLRVAAHFLPGLFDYTLFPSIDGIVWTLNIEMKFYAVCLLLIPLFRRHSLLVFLAPLLLSVAAWFGIDPIGRIGGATAARGFVTWLAVMYIDFMFVGVVFHFWFRGRLALWQVVSLIAVLLAAMIMVWHKSIPVPLRHIWSYGAALVFFAAAFLLRDGPAFKPRVITDFFANISYPLYVVHGVLGYVIMRIALETGLPATVAIVSAACAVIGLSVAIHHLVEKPTHLWGKALARRYRTGTASPTPTSPADPSSSHYPA